MNRLLTLRVRTAGCAADASLNDLPLVRVGGTGGATALPVHEFLLRGLNRLMLRVDPASIDAGADVPPSAELVLHLARAPVDLDRSSILDTSGQRDLLLARTGWGAGFADAGGAPTEPTTSSGEGEGAGAWHRGVDVDLPVDLPRWRWLDAPAVPVGSMEAMRARALQCVQQRVLEFRRGDGAGWLGLTRLAREERAVAYGGNVRAREQAFLDTLRAAPDGRPWSWSWPESDDFVLRPEADGRLMSCLRRDGGPVLEAQSRDGRHAWSLPLRLAWLDERLHGLR
ncbi:hypothetical protein [Roseateles amylovorans]|uniref:Uncharacterized protein n=1 Tax=Roseateles amylovorans TaxID=2978473 RepID=A0ABY6AWF5_9BURK|nr:hypothetical protein [Roseateles amylovorans]UXH76146.1 hypothetical protein N4261_13795 [Roseateles amylovorans]